jgi:hypothetical protein
VELVHFEVKRRKNYRIPGSKTLTFPKYVTVYHEKLSANRNFVVELVHFEVKRHKNYRIPGSKTLTFFYVFSLATV